MHIVGLVGNKCLQDPRFIKLYKVIDLATKCQQQSLRWLIFTLLSIMDEEDYEEFDLDLLEEQVQLEDYKQTKEEEIRLMNKAMDIRLKHLETQKNAQMS